MRLKGASLGVGRDAGLLHLSSDGGQTIVDLEDYPRSRDLLRAGALLMRNRIAAEAAAHGGVLFSEQIPDIDADVLAPLATTPT